MLGKLVNALIMNNPAVVIAQHIDKLKVSGRKVSTGQIKCIDKVDKVLVSTAQIQKLFPKGKSKRVGGVVFTNPLLMHNEDIIKII